MFLLLWICYEKCGDGSFLFISTVNVGGGNLSEQIIVSKRINSIGKFFPLKSCYLPCHNKYNS